MNAFELYYAWKKRYLELAKFALEQCPNDDCKGDPSVGIPPCPYYNEFIKGCFLKSYIKAQNELMFEPKEDL